MTARVNIKENKETKGEDRLEKLVENFQSKT